MNEGVNKLVGLLGEGIDSVINRYPEIRLQYTNERIVTYVLSVLILMTVAIITYVFFMEYILNEASAGELYGLIKEDKNKERIENYLKRRKTLITLGVVLIVIIFIGETLGTIYTADYYILRQLLR